MPDGLHPSDAGALRIARRLIGFYRPSDKKDDAIAPNLCYDDKD